jgi:KaiC/GvpD/RAD55 family RecA-like ATPase
VSDSRARILLDLFRGRADYVAVANGDGKFCPKPLPEPMQPDWLAKRHLAGVQCLGFYLQTPDSKVLCSCVDFDGNPAKPNPDPQWREKAVTVALFLSNVGLKPLVEVSQSAHGAHVWLFFDPPAEAWLVRAWWRVVEQKTGVHFKEIYPRQDYLSGKGLGNLVRYPLWNLSRFVEPEDWSELSTEALESFERATAAQLKTVAFQLGVSELRPGDPPTVPPAEAPPLEQADPELSPRVQARVNRQGSLLARRWAGDAAGMKDDSRSALVLAVATELVRQYVPTPEIEQAVRYWCHENEYEKGRRADWVRTTVGKAYDFVFARAEERSASPTRMPDACNAYLDRLARGESWHLPTGIDELDLSIDGLAPGEMAVVAARPSQGKTALGCQWADSAAARGVKCLIISEEMSAVELGKRALCSFSVLPQKDWQPEAVPGMRAEVRQHYASRANIYVVENCATIDRCEDVIDQHCSLHGVKLVVVDYLQLLGAKGPKRYEQVTDVSRRLKQAARRNDCPLVALCQLNREVEARPGHEPRLSDLRDSGGIEQDADLVVFLQWPIRFDPTAPPDEFRIFVSKRRNGPIRTAKILTKFNADTQTIGWFPGPAVRDLATAECPIPD